MYFFNLVRNINDAFSYKNLSSSSCHQLHHNSLDILSIYYMLVLYKYQFISFLQQRYEVGAIILISYVRKLSYTEVK